MSPKARRVTALFVLFALVGSLLRLPQPARAESAATPSGPQPVYQKISELEGKRIAYVNGSVYNQKVQAKVSGTSEQFYPALADCVAAVEAGKADAAVQLGYCCELVVNRKGGSVAMIDPRAGGQRGRGLLLPQGRPAGAAVQSSDREV